MKNHRYEVTYTDRGTAARYTLTASLAAATEAAALTASTGGTEVALRRGYGDHGLVATF